MLAITASEIVLVLVQTALDEVVGAMEEMLWGKSVA